MTGNSRQMKLHTPLTGDFKHGQHLAEPPANLAPKAP